MTTMWMLIFFGCLLQFTCLVVVDAFSPHPITASRHRHPYSARRVPLASTTAAIGSSANDALTQPKHQQQSEGEEEVRSEFGPLSLSFDELTKRLAAGNGRSQAVWDCYRMGIDPLLFYNSTIDESELDSSLRHCLPDNDDSEEQQEQRCWTRDDLRQLITSRRRNKGLGTPALHLLSKITKDAVAAGRESGSSTWFLEDSIATISHVSRALDGTTKLLIQLQQGEKLQVETVIIPWHDLKRSTLCISSQVGCRQGCTFCATGRMGKLRSLTADEILAQVVLARKVCRVLGVYDVDGVVFMGMGEPADNADAVVRAANVLTDQNQFGMARQKVTVSTVGPTPESFAELGRAPVALAWSVHATRDEVRKRLVPTTQYTMEELMDGYCRALLERPPKLRTTMMEIALIDGVNDSLEDADHLASFCQKANDKVPGMKLMINLIPFNDIGHAIYRKPSQERILAFRDRLTSRGIKSFVRTTRGDDESAACGQLATKKKKKATAPKTDPNQGGGVATND